MLSSLKDKLRGSGRDSPTVKNGSDAPSLDIAVEGEKLTPMDTQAEQQLRLAGVDLISCTDW